MQADPVPLVKDLVLIGGGHTHALVLRRLGMSPVPGLRLSLINPGPTAPYTGMLPGHIAGHYDRSELEIDLVRLARFAGARIVLDRATGIDPAARRVLLRDRAPVAYDILSVDIGITSEMPSLPGFSEHAVPAKPMDAFADRWSVFCAGDGPARVAVLGGGVAGVELALACAHRLRTLGRYAKTTVIERNRLLDQVAEATRQRLIQELHAAGIDVIEHIPPVAVTNAAVALEDGRQVAADLIIGAAGAAPHGWLEETGLALEGGYISVDRHLRSVSHPDIYACGDCAHLSHAPRPKAGVYAVRAAPVLERNLRAALTGSRQRAFRPQGGFLKLVSLGDRSAVGEKAGAMRAGPWVWRLKDRIDRRFMAQFRDLRPMAAPAPPSGAAKGVAAELDGPQPCGGCGAKLGLGALAPALASGLSGTRDDVISRPGDDAAILRIGGQVQVISTDHLRGFAEDPALVARVAAIHALGDIWAMGAAPQAALATVILPRMTARLQRRWMEEIMSAASRIFAAEGAEIVGGHSSMGSELTIGFTVTGLCEHPPLTHAGAGPGDVLLLSRRLGIGVMLAAEMQMKAAGAEVAATWARMGRSQGRLAARLAPVATAMTDVTGFGLAGHLATICEASGLGAEVDLAALPVIPEADRLAASGLRSSLYAQNRAALDGLVSGAEGSRGDLVFDPQTAGGLLAAVPEDRAEKLVEDLRAEGHGIARIGALTDISGQIHFR